MSLKATMQHCRLQFRVRRPMGSEDCSIKGETFSEQSMEHRNPFLASWHGPLPPPMTGYLSTYPHQPYGQPHCVNPPLEQASPTSPMSCASPVSAHYPGFLSNRGFVSKISSPGPVIRSPVTVPPPGHRFFPPSRYAREATYGMNPNRRLSDGAMYPGKL